MNRDKCRTRDAISPSTSNWPGKISIRTADIFLSVDGNVANGPDSIFGISCSNRRARGKEDPDAELEGIGRRTIEILIRRLRTKIVRTKFLVSDDARRMNPIFPCLVFSEISR